MTQDLNLGQSEPKPKKKKTITVVVFSVIILVILYVVATSGVQWWQEKQMWVNAGFASDKFPFRMFTERELVEKGLWSGESSVLNAVITTVPPEEIYAKFRQALIDGNLDLAVECFIENQQADWKKSLYEIKENGFLQGMINDLPRELEDTYIYTDEFTGKDTKNRNLNNTAIDLHEYIIIRDGKNWSQTITFRKNWNGVWLIESLQ
jgi:hypothetical protein